MLIHPGDPLFLPINCPTSTFSDHLCIAFRSIAKRGVYKNRFSYYDNYYHLFALHLFDLKGGRIHAYDS